MPSRRGVLASTAAALGSGLSGCVVRGLHAPSPDLGGLAGRSGSTAPGGPGPTATRSFEWTHDGVEYDCRVAVPEVLHAYASARPRVRNRGAYVADPYHDDLLDAIAERLAAASVGSDADPLAVARTFVQQLPYATDADSTGRESYARYPSETILAGRADCEDAAVLLSGLFERLGRDTVLLAFWEAEHMGLGVATDEPVGTGYPHGGTRYAYLETATSGWTVGETPDVVAGERPEVMTVQSLPTLVSEWATEQTTRGLRARVTVRNVGDGPAEDVGVRLLLESANGDVLGTGRSDTRPLAAADAGTFTTVVRPSTEGVERARIEVTVREEVVDAVVV